MTTRNIQDVRFDLAEARCKLNAVREVLRTRQPLIESELIAWFCGGDPRRLGVDQVDRQRQLAVLCDASEELHSLREAARLRGDAVIRLSAELRGRVDGRREVERQTRERLADAIMALASNSVPGIARDAVLSEVGGRLS